MKIGILGSGNVAKVLGNGLLAKGHEVKLGSRTPEKLNEWLEKAQNNASIGTFSEVAEFGEVIFLCTLGNAVQDAITLSGIEKFSNKVIIDVTNPLDFSQGLPPKFTATIGNSLGEEIQRLIPEAHVVKAFNTISVNIMVNPKLEEGTPTLLISGNNSDAKKTVTTIAEDFGWEVEDLGGIEQAFLIEAQAMLWISYGFKNNHWTHAFKLLKK